MPDPVRVKQGLLEGIFIRGSDIYFSIANLLQSHLVVYKCQNYDCERLAVFV